MVKTLPLALKRPPRVARLVVYPLIFNLLAENLHPSRTGSYRKRDIRLRIGSVWVFQRGKRHNKWVFQREPCFFQRELQRGEVGVSL
jgi:hypothetical protein